MSLSRSWAVRKVGLFTKTIVMATKSNKMEGLRQ